MAVHPLKGLLDQNFFTPPRAARHQAAYRALGKIGQGLLAAGAPSRIPQGFGSIMGAIGGFPEAYEKGLDRFGKKRLTALQMENARPRRKFIETERVREARAGLSKALERADIPWTGTPEQQARLPYSGLLSGMSDRDRSMLQIPLALGESPTSLLAKIGAPPKAAATSKLAKLIEEQGQYEPESPEWKTYQGAIDKLSKSAEKKERDWGTTLEGRAYHALETYTALKNAGGDIPKNVITAARTAAHFLRTRKKFYTDDSGAVRAYTPPFPKHFAAPLGAAAPPPAAAPLGAAAPPPLVGRPGVAAPLPPPAAAPPPPVETKQPLWPGRQPTPSGTLIAPAQEMKPATRKKAEAKLMAVHAGMARLREIIRTFDPKFQQIPHRFWMAITDLKSRLGPKLGKTIGNLLPGWEDKVTDEDRKALAKFATFRRTSINNINLYIKEITGAQMSNAEAIRLKRAMPDAGTSILTGDGPIVFETKMLDVHKALVSVSVRLKYAIRHGYKLGFWDNFPLRGLPSFEKRGEQLTAYYRSRNIPQDKLKDIVLNQLEREGYLPTPKPRWKSKQ